MEIKDIQKRLGNTQARIKKTIELNLAKSEVSAEYQTALLMALPFNAPDHFSISNERWLLLPELCSIACGAREDTTEYISAAWYLFYVAAYLMDHVEDGLLGKSRSALPSSLLNIASGQFFLANIILNDFIQSHALSTQNLSIFRAFQHQLLRMCDGQQLDITIQQLNLRDYFEIARLKSGTFFSLACWSGARLATDDEKILHAYAEFGSHLGLIIQVLDDLEDWQTLQNGSIQFEPAKYQRILPFLYAKEVIPVAEKEKLIKIMKNLIESPNEKFIQDYCKIIEKAGAGLYMVTVLNREFDQARSAIADLHPENEADKMLLYMVGSLLNK